jgi:NAD(P)-dependent dehydrogenase (short-subunit alcohol dehydrogenase family)
VTRGHYRSLFDLSGKRALVTGATGILGNRFARGLADCGAEVVCLDLDPAACEALAKELISAYGVTCHGVACDLRDAQAIERAVADIESRIGALDILINNAATKTDSVPAFLAPLEDYDVETWRQVMAVNLDGAFLMARAVGRRMADRGKGSIVQIASIYGLLGPDQRIYEGSQYFGHRINTPPVYTASKAGVIGLTKHLATYWGHRGVRVNTLTPGGVESGQNDTFQSRYGARIPLGRMARADEIVGAMLFLASDASGFVTGHNLVADGGLAAW